MQNQNNNPLGQDADNTSTPATDTNNSGESVPQVGENIVNEQEQNKSVNLEEFVDDTAQNTKKANQTDEDDQLPAG